ncbi:MAG: MFS transporter, partial [Betaproteobacteria bacterium]|nr:MFS transporter [Betaproteobacteria bacterium]
LYLVLGYDAPYFQLQRHGAAQPRVEAQRHGQELFPAPSVARTLKDSAASWRTWPLVGLYFTSFGGFLALTAWLPMFWGSFYGAPHWVALGLTAGFSLLSSLIRVPGGSWADRFGGENVAFVAYALLLAGAVLMTTSASFGLSAAGEALMGLGMGVANAAVFKLVPQYVPDAVGGTAGWVGGLGALGGFAVPPMLGRIAQTMGHAGYARGYAVYVVLALVSLALTALLYATRGGVKHAALGAPAH